MRRIAPESTSWCSRARRLEHVRFVDGGDALLAGARELERLSNDAPDLRVCVLEGVDDARGPGLLLAEARLAEVKAARQLAHEEDVDALDAFGLER
jgi:hypothetical protein